MWEGLLHAVDGQSRSRGITAYESFSGMFHPHGVHDGSRERNITSNIDNDDHDETANRKAAWRLGTWWACVAGRLDDRCTLTPPVPGACVGSLEQASLSTNRRTDDTGSARLSPKKKFLRLPRFEAQLRYWSYEYLTCVNVPLMYATALL